MVPGMTTAAAASGSHAIMAPFGLIRTPILRPDETITMAWHDLRAAHAKLRSHDAWVRRLADAAIERLTVALATADKPTYRAIIDVRRALYNGRQPTRRALRRAGGAASIVVRSVQRRSRLEAAVAQAWTMGHAAERNHVHKLLAQPTFRQAIALAAPDLIAQSATAAGKRGRMTARTLLRLAWRAAGRPAPMGGFATTSLFANEYKTCPVGAGPACFVTTRVRGNTLPLLVREPDDPPLLDCETVERRLWQAALLDLTLLSDAGRATHWREVAGVLHQGGTAPGLDQRDVRSLWFERLDRTTVHPDPADFGRALPLLARYGSQRIGRSVRPTAGRLLAAMGLSDEGGQADFAAFAARAERALIDRYDEATVSVLPLESLLDGKVDASAQAARSAVDRALAAGGTIAAEDADAFSCLSPQPLRAACRIRRAGCGRMRLTHWGGDAMTVLAPYRETVEAIDGAHAVLLGDWAARWPGAVDVALDTLGAAGRQHRFAPRRIVHHADAADEIALEELTVVWGSGRVVVLSVDGAAIDQAIHPGVTVEQATGFASRLLVALCRAPPTPVELMLAALNRRLAQDIAEWLARADAPPVLTLPEVNLDDALLLAPAAWCIRLTSGNVFDVWSALVAANMPLGLAECRFAGVLGEPRIVDLASPDGIGLLLASGSAFAHLTPLEAGYIAEFCIELTAESGK